jgi:hypothetical protein
MPIDMRPPWIDATTLPGPAGRSGERGYESRRREIQNLLDAIAGRNESPGPESGISGRQPATRSACAHPAKVCSWTK